MVALYRRCIISALVSYGALVSQLRLDMSVACISYSLGSVKYATLEPWIMTVITYA